MSAYELITRLTSRRMKYPQAPPLSTDSTEVDRNPITPAVNSGLVPLRVPSLATSSYVTWLYCVHQSHVNLEIHRVFQIDSSSDPILSLMKTLQRRPAKLNQPVSLAVLQR